MIIMLLAAGMAFAGIAGSKHDLSTKNFGTTELCIFCHTPHNAQLGNTTAVPLWNHVTTAVTTYTLYTSATLDATPTQPTGVSLACMSCHDGTIAVDAYYSQPGNTLHAGTTKINQAPFSGSANLGTDLRNTHPVSFTYNAALVTADQTHSNASSPQLATPNAGMVGGKLPLFGAGKDQLECASCHAVHDPTNIPFLRMANTGSALCLTCHTK